MTVPPLLGSSPSPPYKRCEVGVCFFLTPSYMARNYESEAVEKFLLLSQPDEGNFTLRTAYETALKAYQCNHTHVMEVHKWWKQGEQIEDACQEAAEWSRKCHCLEEAEAG